MELKSEIVELMKAESQKALNGQYNVPGLRAATGKMLGVIISHKPSSDREKTGLMIIDDNGNLIDSSKSKVENLPLFLVIDYNGEEGIQCGDIRTTHAKETVGYALNSKWLALARDKPQGLKPANMLHGQKQKIPAVEEYWSQYFCETPWVETELKYYMIPVAKTLSKVNLQDLL